MIHPIPFAVPGDMCRGHVPGLTSDWTLTDEITKVSQQELSPPSAKVYHDTTSSLCLYDHLTQVTLYNNFINTQIK